MVVGDAPFIHELFTDPDFVRNIGDRGVSGLDSAADYIRNGPLASYARHGFGFLTVESDGRSAGICGLIRRDGLDHPDLGFAFLPEFRGDGLATEAAGAVLAGATQYGLGTVLAIVDPENAASRRVLEKIGMASTGHVQLPDDSKRLELYSKDLGMPR